MARRPVKTGQISLTMPQFIIDDIEELSKELEISRSEVIADILRVVLGNEELLNKVYPLEEEPGG